MTPQTTIEPVTRPGATDVAGSIGAIDHCTYVSTDERAFLGRWASLGFSEVLRLRTERFPATHIALATEIGFDPSARVMTGLSVSEDPRSAVNEFVRRYGEGLQHVGYLIRDDADMGELARTLEASGTQMMTEPLLYVDDDGAELTQMFTAPLVPYGPFIELVQRRPGRSGTQFDGFSVATIEDLYERYTDFSRFLDVRSAT